MGKSSYWVRRFLCRLKFELTYSKMLILHMGADYVFSGDFRLSPLMIIELSFAT